MRTVVLVLAVCGVLSGPAVGQEVLAPPSPPPLSVADYVAALDQLRTLLEVGAIVEARTAARELSEREVVWADERLTPDPTVLDAVQQVRTPAEARLQAVRVRILVEALSGGTDATGVEPRPDVLSRITPGTDIEKGGDAPRLRVKPLTFGETIEAALLAVVDWIGTALKKLLEWLRRLAPRRPQQAPGDAGTTAFVAVAFAAVVVAFLVILAVRTLRRGGPGPIDAVSSPAVSSARDEDPLSREASGWESYAQELAAKRRWREAIRAWYHAVLVTLFRSGLLHHQRGRTNWEYVSRLGPDLRWRPGFVALTRRFDREWYGRRTSDGAALSECAREAREVLRAVRGAEEAT